MEFSNNEELDQKIQDQEFEKSIVKETEND